MVNEAMGRAPSVAGFMKYAYSLRAGISGERPEKDKALVIPNLFKSIMKQIAKPEFF